MLNSWVITVLWVVFVCLFWFSFSVVFPNNYYSKDISAFQIYFILKVLYWSIVALHVSFCCVIKSSPS